jgi:hypothetical protein
MQLLDVPRRIRLLTEKSSTVSSWEFVIFDFGRLVSAINQAALFA